MIFNNERKSYIDVGSRLSSNANANAKILINKKSKLAVTSNEFE